MGRRLCAVSQSGFTAELRRVHETSLICVDATRSGTWSITVLVAYLLSWSRTLLRRPMKKRHGTMKFVRRVAGMRTVVGGIKVEKLQEAFFTLEPKYIRAAGRSRTVGEGIGNSMNVYLLINKII